MVFLLTVACAGGLVALRCGLLPKEDAGRVVIEILDKPTKAEMQAHAERIRSGAVLELAVKDLSGAQPRNVREDIRDRLQQNLDVTASGPFLTVTVYEKTQSPAELANAVAEAYRNDLNALADDIWKREAQNRVAQITLMELTVEKARLEWLDIMKKHDLRPEAGSVIADAAAKEIAARLAKANADLAMLESGMTGKEAADTDLVAMKSSAAVLTAQISAWQKMSKEQEAEVLSRLQRRSDMDYASERYESQRRLLHNLREEDMKRNISAGVVKRPTRIVEEARPLTVPDRRLVKFVRLGTAASSLLLVALLLTALATRLCRRG